MSSSCRFDRERERVSLGYKQRFEDPWILVPEKYPVGKRVEGKIVSIVDYGAFVVLEEGVEGLIHVSEMSWTKKIKNPRSMLEIDQEVEVVVSEVDADKRRLSLSLRATQPNPWEQVAETYNVGSTIKGVVRNLTDFGAFVEIVPGVDGLVHISDMSWTRRINHPSEVVQKGDEVEAVITSVDSYNQRISLSMKELLPNEWEEYANSHGVGDVDTGSVTNVTDFGVFVELAPGVEGLCHISEIDRDEGLSLAEMFSAGPTGPVPDSQSRLAREPDRSFDARRRPGRERRDQDGARLMFRSPRPRWRRPCGSAAWSRRRRRGRRRRPRKLRQARTGGRRTAEPTPKQRRRSRRGSRGRS